MTAFEKIGNRIDANNRKLKSLQEYKNIILSNKDQIDSDLLQERIGQIDSEVEQIKKSIHANQKAQAHYNAAFNHLVDLRSLDHKLQLAIDLVDREAIEAEILEHTQKLQKHLSILPGKLVNEIQQKYLEYVENNPLAEDEVQMPPQEPEMSPVEEEIVEENMVVEEANELGKALLNIFEQEIEEFLAIREFASLEELESFLDRYKAQTIECYKHFTEFSSVFEEREEQVEEKTPEVILNSLVENITSEVKTSEKLSSTNVNISDTFKDELKSGKWLYNVVHYGTELANVENISNEEFMHNIATSAKNNARIEILKERLATLSVDDAKKLYDEYYNTSKLLTTAIKVLLEEKINQ